MVIAVLGMAGGPETIIMHYHGGSMEDAFQDFIGHMHEQIDSEYEDKRIAFMCAVNTVGVKLDELKLKQHLMSNFYTASDLYQSLLDGWTFTVRAIGGCHISDRDQRPRFCRIPLTYATARKKFQRLMENDDSFLWQVDNAADYHMVDAVDELVRSFCRKQ